MTTIHDENERQQALDPSQSFIVQAPAGSGKTELLTQRFLILLSSVKQPEEILAITFTKKSAAEMRARIIKSLKNARQDNEPESAHAKKTWGLARRVLQQAKELKWNLLENPNRLRIQTIDSFNAYLTKQLPILSHFGATPEIIDNPHKLYREAVQEFLTHLEENVAWSESIAQLLMHMDNDLNKVEELLINMLAKRDQWLPYIMLNANNESLRQTLESHLASVTIDILKKLRDAFPKDKMSELLVLADFAAHNVKRDNPSSPIATCAGLSNLPGISIHDKTHWLALAELLFTKKFEWRKKIDKNIGFPAPTSMKNPDEKLQFSNLKQRLSTLIDELVTQEKCRLIFEELASTPHHEYQENQWQTLNALHTILQIVVAQLKLVFQQHGKIDYIENAQGALEALGSEDAPTDITLALDYQIKHILIDEFQDTSNSQYRLIEKLTAGWEPGDGRTLFLVGDPMQSIYRFREAEVGLFIRARSNGIGHVKCIPLTLSVNFRSVAGVVSWVNQQFKTVLPPFNDIAMGAVSYSPSIPYDQTTVADSVFLHPLVDADEKAQAQRIIQLIEQLKHKNPHESIVVLVRSRTHLAAIMPALKNANIAYRAIDIDPLDSRPIIQDLMVLTRALLHPADRIAWLALLRAPWCGLSLSDLLSLSVPHQQSCVWERLQNQQIIKRLSNEGQQRLARIIPILQTKIADRNRYALRIWLENTWLALGGPASAANATDLDDAAAYFHLLEKFDYANDLPDLADLQAQVSRLFAAPNNQVDNSLQIMTIHNAKGLEFDTVILPHLERKSPSDDKQLLLWMERPQQNDSSALMLAPIHALSEKPDSIYEYIKKQQSIKNNYETGRLLYVAATRAKKRLHCFFNLQTNDSNEIAQPLPKSLLEKLWSAIKNEAMPQLIHHTKSDKDTLQIKPRSINRLTLDWINPLKEILPNDHLTYHNKKAGFLLPEQNPRIIGILIHKILQQICHFNTAWWTNKPSEQKQQYLHLQLIQSGMLKVDVSTAIDQILLAIDNTLHDPRGQWILQAHQEAKNEFHISSIVDSKVQSLILDRTFVDTDGIRWIIDYKTSLPGDKNIEQFLVSEQEKYQKQMLRYADAIQKIDPRPIQLGLYFPLIPAWREWQ